MRYASTSTISVIVREVIASYGWATGEIERLVLVLTRGDGSQALPEDMSRVHRQKRIAEAPG